MSLQNLLIQSQLIPPRNRQSILTRARIARLLENVVDYPLMIVQAGTGYGKSTELASLAERIPNLFWYSVRTADRDPFLFLVNLFSAFNQNGHSWGKKALEDLEETPQAVHVDRLRPLLNELTIGLRGDVILVIDDFHLIDDVSEIEGFLSHMVDYAPPGLHIILSTRKIPNYSNLSRWRVKGLLKVIGRNELAFQRDEIIALFQDHYQYPVSLEQANLLLKETEGWAIALQMIWQSLQNGYNTIEQVLYQRPITLEALFDYLASEVLGRLPKELQDFLITAAVLNQIEPEICNLILNISNSEEIIRSMQESGLFIYSVGENVYQYQNLFHDFLRTQLWKDPYRAKQLHLQVANYLLAQTRIETAIYHLLAADEYHKAGNLVVQIGQAMIDMGRLDSLMGWINKIPAEICAEIAGLQLLLGHIRRLKSDFDGALVHFAKAEKLFSKENDHLGHSFALRGQAQIFLDTIRPLKAETLLEEALRLLEPQEFMEETAALLDQLAENKLNLGHPDQAKALHHEAQLLRNETDPGDVYLESRALLRTGHLNEARELLTPRALDELESVQNRAHHFHRETLMLLALICIMQGDVDATISYAKEGIKIGRRLNSQFVEAVGFMRLGHAFEIQGLSSHRQALLDAAEQLYHQAIEKVQMFKVTRVQVEPLWALSRLYGYQGKLLEAQDYARQAKEIASQAGDKWLYHLVNVSLGASYSMAGQAKEAISFLNKSFEGFKYVADSYGVAASLLWLALTHWIEGDAEQASKYMSQLIPLVKAGRYDYLFTQPTYLGLKDQQNIIPLLLELQKRGIEQEYIEQVLKKMGLSELDYHPGYSLHVKMLGVFEVYRGNSRIRSGDWQREKARQLFQLFLLNPDEWLQREQIVDRLWPDLTPDAAIRDFKVALNALNRALEPGRPRGEQPFFIIRRDNLYSINPQAKIWIDVQMFEVFARSDDQYRLEEALQLYTGEFLADSLYCDWTENRRKHIKQQYLIAAEKLAEHYYTNKQFDDVIQICEQIISIEATWEMAYRMLMRTYAAKNNRAQVFHAFTRCQSALQDELGVEPTEATIELLEELVNKPN